MRREDHQRILAAVRSRVAQTILHISEQQNRPLDEFLAESVFNQRHRLKNLPNNRTNRADSVFWDHVQRALGRADNLSQRSLLSQIIARYADQVCGNFDERVYRMARQALPQLLNVLLNTSSPKRLLMQRPSVAPLEDAVIVQGETEHLRRLHEIGTVILAPTHVSNLDSVVLAFAILQLGLPLFVYGAAQDLFSNPLLGFFLHNLGAYVVDRRNQDPLYKRVLKEYASMTLELGYDNLFFPAGSRSRSGAVERSLRLGLIGTSIAAYINNLRRTAPRPKIFVVPATLSYQLVLEAETLMDDFLKDVGQSRYIITDDEFWRPQRVFEFMTQLFALDSKIYVTMGRGFDPFGNPVDDDGESIDPHGRRIDASRYVYLNNIPEAVLQRDHEYAFDLSQSLVAAYSRDNVIQPTHLTARVIFSLLRKQSSQPDLLRFIRVSAGGNQSVPLREVYKETRRLLEQLREFAQNNKLRLSPVMYSTSIEDLVSDGLRHFDIYHRLPAAVRRGDHIVSRDRSLLFYYQNRLEGYGLERSLDLTPALSADHQTLDAS